MEFFQYIDNGERDNYYTMLLNSILNAQYALDSHMHIVKTLIANILIYNKGALAMNEIESVFEKRLYYSIITGKNVHN